MRFLIIDAHYPAFLEAIYRNHPGLEARPYDEQITRIRDGLFGEAAFQAAALRALGHEAEVIVTNAHAAQRAWAAEHGMANVGKDRRRFRLRRGVIPWLAAPSAGTNWQLVLAQVRAFRPDVLYVEIMDTIPSAIAAELQAVGAYSVAQIAATVPTGQFLAYDLVVSSIPTMVEEFRGDGIRSEWVPLAFEPGVRQLMPASERDLEVSFVGSFTPAYPDRARVAEAVAGAADLQTWTADRTPLAPDSPILPTIRGSAFGREMYEVMGRSRLTLNSHAIWAGPDANNLRLYEATGMGALLVTDDRRNLGELFEVGSEIVTYRSPGEAAELVRHYLDHPDEARRIAAAGQARTLAEHTWANRMTRIVELVDQRI